MLKPRHIALLLLSGLVFAALATAAPAPNPAAKRPASVHLKPPAAKMPATRKDARPPQRRASDVAVTRPQTTVLPQPAATAQSGPPVTVPRAREGQSQAGDTQRAARPGLLRRVSSGSIRVFKQASLKSFGARVYASMKSIFISKTPTDTRHVAHEAWHVVQQTSGQPGPSS